MDLTRSPNKIFVFTAVGVVVLLWVLVWLFGPQPEPIKPSPPVNAMLTSLLQSGKQGKKEEDKIVKEVVPDAWGRDPFALPPWVEEMEEGATQPVETARSQPEPGGGKPSYKLSTILISGSNRLAVIDDRVYAVGDKIGGEEISEITLDKVVLMDDSGERVLTVPQPQTQVIVQDAGGK